MIQATSSLDNAADFSETCQAFIPRERIGYLEWCKQNIISNEGRPYDDRAYPHIGAPGGPADAFDDPNVREIWLQWASRLGKTFFGQSAQQYVADISPCPQMFASSSQKVALEVIARTYAMIAQNKRLEPLLPPPHRRKQDRIDLRDCEIHVAWARSKDTLADKNVKVGHANELDKWEHVSTSTEGDPLKLFMDRGKSFQATRKYILESTPAVRNRSRIEDGLNRSTNCRLFVPCAHCGRYQQLRMGREYYELRKLPGEPRRGGLRFDLRAGGRADAFTARDTARYECEYCDGVMVDHHRAPMMRAGVWVPFGCEVDHDGAALVTQEREPFRGWHKAVWVTGTPTRDGPAAGYQLSSLYALSLGWGDIASEFADSIERPQLLRNFINQWLGETWELVARGQTWEQLITRLSVNMPHGVIPAGHSILTVGIDKQQHHCVYVVVSWGADRTGHIVDYGTADDEEKIFAEVLNRMWPCQDGGTMYSDFALIDSGFRPAVVYDFCRSTVKRGRKIMPCKGATSSLGTPFRVSELGKNTSAPGMMLCNVDTISTQDWLERRLYERKPGEPGALSLYKDELIAHQDFAEQLLNDAVVTDLDTKNYERETWQRADTNTPNDYRDCLRYASVAMLLATKGRPIRERVPQEQPTGSAPRQPPTQPARRPPVRQSQWLNRRPF